MFQVPDAKRAKRSEALSSDHQSSSPEPATTKIPNPNYGFEYDFITPTQQPPPTDLNITTSPSSHQDAKQPLPPEETFEFRLFTSTAPSTFTVQPTTPPADIPLSEGRFTHPNRPDSYYFTSATAPSTLTHLQHQYTISAISSSTLLAQSHTPWPGTSLPWRVTHLKSSSTNLKPSTPPLEQSASKSPLQAKTRNKPSKKRRIVLRQRREARSSLKQQAVEREEAERLKRNVRNREKKIKRRERERRKKAELAGTTGLGTGLEDGDGSRSVKSEGENDEGSGDGDIKIGRNDEVAGGTDEKLKVKMKQEPKGAGETNREPEEEKSRTKAIR